MHHMSITRTSFCNLAVVQCASVFLVKVDSVEKKEREKQFVS